MSRKLELALEVGEWLRHRNMGRVKSLRPGRGRGVGEAERHGGGGGWGGHKPFRHALGLAQLFPSPRGAVQALVF